MKESNDLNAIKMAMEDKKIKEVSIGYGGELVIKFEDGTMTILKQNSFREWSIKYI